MTRWLAASALALCLSAGLAARQTLPPPTVRLGASGPQVTRLSIPPFPGPHAIWGATGQDSRGHIWYGVAAAWTPVPSAHLFEYDPASQKVTDRGNVVDELQKAGLLRPGEHQAKIHSKIVQGLDDYIYFASMDEEGENDDGSKLPTWGGHLWRLKLTTGRWEHVLGVPQALIAVAGADRFIYALGYFGHILYRYDTKSGEFKHIEVGSVDGHISRNFICDYRGHVFVPRLRAETTALGKRRIRVTLVEFNSDLQELKETPIEADRYIFRDNPTETHGIISLQEMANKSWYFNTHVGSLFHVVPPPPVSSGPIDQSPAAISSMGWFHRDGTMYVASLFTPDGTDTLYGLGHNGQRYDWLTYDLVTKICRVSQFSVATMDDAALGRSLLYGSGTRDASGGHYVVGVTPMPGNGDGFGPIVLRVQPSTRPRDP